MNLNVLLNPVNVLVASFVPSTDILILTTVISNASLYSSEAVSKALDIRKNGERPFNLLKKREGLEQVRVRSHHGVVVRTTFTTTATLLLELAGTRRTKK